MPDYEIPQRKWMFINTILRNECIIYKMLYLHKSVLTLFLLSVQPHCPVNGHEIEVIPRQHYRLAEINPSRSVE
jgi:hypothetical protein